MHPASHLITVILITAAPYSSLHASLVIPWRHGIDKLSSVSSKDLCHSRNQPLARMSDPYDCAWLHTGIPALLCAYTQPQAYVRVACLAHPLTSAHTNTDIPSVESRKRVSSAKHTFRRTEGRGALPWAANASPALPAQGEVLGEIL